MNQEISESKTNFSKFELSPGLIYEGESIKTSDLGKSLTDFLISSNIFKSENLVPHGKGYIYFPELEFEDDTQKFVSSFKSSLLDKFIINCHNCSMLEATFHHGL